MKHLPILPLPHILSYLPTIYTHGAISSSTLPCPFQTTSQVFYIPVDIDGHLNGLPTYLQWIILLLFLPLPSTHPYTTFCLPCFVPLFCFPPLPVGLPFHSAP